MKYIAIEGLNCAGKTTLGRKLSKELDLPLLKLPIVRRYDKDILEITRQKYYHEERLWVYNLPFNNVLIDRSLYSGITYGILNNFNPLTESREFQEEFKEYQPIGVVWLDTSPEICMKRFEKRGGGYVPTMDDLEILRDAYTWIFETRPAEQICRVMNNDDDEVIPFVKKCFGIK